MFSHRLNWSSNMSLNFRCGSTVCFSFLNCFRSVEDKLKLKVDVQPP